MKSLNWKGVARVLRKYNFILSRQKGSHLIFRNAAGTIVPVPCHGGNKPIPIGTFLAIVKQSKIPKEKFK